MRIYGCALTVIMGLAAFLAQRANAQQALGYTTLDWDSDSSLLFAHSETDLDDNAASFYEARVVATLRAQNSFGTVAGASATDTSGAGSVSVDFVATGDFGTTYTLTGVHSGKVTYYYDEGCGAASIPIASGATPLIISGCSYDYYDYYWFGYFGGNDVYPGFWNWFGPGPARFSRLQAVRLGTTVDKATVQTGSCSGNRGRLLAEYTPFPSFGMSCNTITSGAYSIFFDFSQLNYPSPRTAPAEFSDVAIFIREGLYYLDAWRIVTPLPTFQINSGFRDPRQNLLAGGAINPPSEHMAGDAFDIATAAPHGDAEWQFLNNLARYAYGPAGWYEPEDGPCKTGCMHADSRYASKTYIYP